MRDRVSEVSYTGVNSNRQHAIIIESDPPGFADRVVRLLLILFIKGHTKEQETYFSH